MASGKGSKAILNNYSLAECEKERDGLRAQLDKAQRQTRDALIASKEETIALLKATFNRPS